MTPRTRELVLGIDGGGSKTVALLADRDGRLLGRGNAGSSNYLTVGTASAWAVLEEAMRGAFDDAGLAVQPLAAACVGLAGVGRPGDRSLVQAWASERLPGTPVAVVNDADLVLAAGVPDGWGVALICGTGSIVYGRDPAGREMRAGGWGYLLGDEGSGYAIGLAALRASARAADGRGAETSLLPVVLAHWHLSNAEDLIGRVYREQMTTTAIADLATLVEAEATRGDAVAGRILEEAGYELALAVSAVTKRLQLVPPVPCAQAGSVILKGRAVARAFLYAAADMGLELAPITPVSEPAQGALRLAHRMIGQG